MKAIKCFILFILVSAALPAQEIRIKAGGYVKVPQNNTLHASGSLLVENNKGFHTNGVVKTGGNLKNLSALPLLIDSGRVVMEGSASQKIAGTLLIDNLKIDNAAGVYLNHDITVNKNLSLTNGNLVLGNYNLKLEENAVITGNPSNSSMVVATGAGQIRRQIINPGVFTFPVGDQTGGSDFTPVVLTFTSGVFGADNFIGVNLVNAKYPDPNIQNNYLKRYWTITTSNISSYTCNARFYYKLSDVVGSESAILCQRLNPPPIEVYNPADTINHFLTAPGLTSFGTFTGAEAPCYTLTASAYAIKHVTCFGGANGSATVIANGGIGSYTYHWSTIPVQTTKTALNLSAGTYTVIVTDALGCSRPSTITINQPPQWWTGLSGPVSVCQNSSGNTYTTDPGMSNYTWTVSPGGTITSGGGTNNYFMTVTWNSPGTQSVSLNYTNPQGCIAAAPTVRMVTVSPQPQPSISGSDSICADTSSVMYATDAGMMSYSWSIPTGGIITSGAGTDKIFVTWTTPGLHTVSVHYNTLVGCISHVTSMNIVVKPLPVPEITGPAELCENSFVQKYTTHAGNTNYQWTVSPGGSIVSGQSTNEIGVIWNIPGIQNVSVTYANAGGCYPQSPTIMNVLVKPLPSGAENISGSSDVCSGSADVAYFTPAIPNATSYVWNLPPGAMIMSGTGTNNIIVNFSPNAVSGNISVFGLNPCGSGAISQLFHIIVTPIPSAPLIRASGDSLISSSTAGNQWYYNGNAIPGATDPFWVAKFSGWYWSVVNINNCFSDTSNNIYMIMTGQEEQQPLTINVYPVPNKGTFFIEINSAAGKKLDISLYNNFGLVIYETKDVEVGKNTLKQLSLYNIPPGMYTLLIKDRSLNYVRKILITE